MFPIRDTAQPRSFPIVTWLFIAANVAAFLLEVTLILADMSRKALGQVKKTVTDILGDRMECDRALQMAEVLASGTWTHDYPISVGEAREIGLAVSTDVPQEIYQLMNLYPQTAQRRPSVEYIPVPYMPRDERKRSAPGA